MIWEFSELVGRRLLLWAVLSFSVGLALWLGIPLPAGPFLHAFGLQALVWGGIDGGIGLIGVLSARRDRRRAAGDPDAPAAAARRLRRLLLLNAALDVGYVTVGIGILVVAAGADAGLQGTAWGVIVQGAFLFVFDLLHARWIPAPEPFLPHGVRLFEGPEHEAFTFEPVEAGPGAAGGQPPVALLVHGFGGTPAEMRPLGAALAAAGWRAHAPLLPGMGAGIRALSEMRVADWEAAVTSAGETLAVESGRPILVIGYSLGGALALATADRLPRAGLVLIAPFWWPSPLWQRLVGPLVRTVLPPGIRPFGRLDFEAPDVRRGIASFLPGLDLDDAGVRAGLRSARLPVAMFSDLFHLSRRVRRAAREVDGPVLIVQGRHDEVVRPERTDRLAATFPERPVRVEVEAGHDLIGPAAPAGRLVLDPVLAFAERIAGDDRTVVAPRATGAPEPPRGLAA